MELIIVVIVNLGVARTGHLQPRLGALQLSLSWIEALATQPKKKSRSRPWCLSRANLLPCPFRRRNPMRQGP